MNLYSSENPSDQRSEEFSSEPYSSIVRSSDYSSVVSLLNPPNPLYAIVVADLLIPLVDYSVVVRRVQE